MNFLNRTRPDQPATRAVLGVAARHGVVELRGSSGEQEAAETVLPRASGRPENKNSAHTRSPLFYPVAGETRTCRTHAALSSIRYVELRR